MNTAGFAWRIIRGSVDTATIITTHAVLCTAVIGDRVFKYLRPHIRHLPLSTRGQESEPASQTRKVSGRHGDIPLPADHRGVHDTGLDPQFTGSAYVAWRFQRH